MAVLAEAGTGREGVSRCDRTVVRGFSPHRSVEMCNQARAAPDGPSWRSGPRLDEVWAWTQAGDDVLSPELAEEVEPRVSPV